MFGIRAAVLAVNAVWTPDQSPSEQDWLLNGQPSAWIQGAEAVFPAAAAAPVTIVDSLPGQQLIYASKITIDDGSGNNYSFVGSTSSDELQIPAGGTTIEVDQSVTSSTTATISASIVNVSGAALTTSGSGSLVIDGSASVATINAAGTGTLEIDGNATVSASTISVTAGTLQIDNGAVVNAAAVTASGGTLDVEGALNVSSGGALAIQDPAVLQGYSGAITLAAGCAGL